MKKKPIKIDFQKLGVKSPMFAAASSPKTTAHPVNPWAGLTVEERILEVLSIIHEPVSRTLLCQILARAQALTDFAGPVNVQSITPFLKNLEAKGNVVFTPDNKAMCSPKNSEGLTRTAVKEGRYRRVALAIRKENPIRSSYGYRYYQTFGEGFQDFRLHFHDGDLDAALFALRNLMGQYPEMCGYYNPLALIASRPLDLEWLAEQKRPVRQVLVQALCQDALWSLRMDARLPEAIKPLIAEGLGSDGLTFRHDLSAIHLLRGEWSEAESLARDIEKTGDGQMLLGALAYLRGNDNEAVQHFESSIQTTPRASSRKYFCWTSLAGIFFPLALIRRRGPGDLDRAANYFESVQREKTHYQRIEAETLSYVVRFLRGDTQGAPDPRTYRPEVLQTIGTGALFICLALHWAELNALKPNILSVIEELRLPIEKRGYRWVAREYAELLARIGVDTEINRARADALGKELGAPSILDTVPRVEPWERSLDALLQLTPVEGGETKAATEHPERLVWRLDLRPTVQHCHLEPYVQKRLASGGWSRGRPVALSRLQKEGAVMEFLTPADRELCGAVRMETYGNRYYGQMSYSIDVDSALPLLVNHPLVFWSDNPERRVEVATANPELRVLNQGDWILVDLAPRPWASSTIAVIKESPNRVQVVRFAPEHKRIHAVLGEKGLRVPAAAKERVLKTIGAIAPLLTVHSDIGGGAFEVESVEADPRPVIQLRPYGSGLKALLLVRPFGDNGSCYRPGAGGETVIAEVEGKRLQARRNLADERIRAEILTEHCPVLHRILPFESEWTVEELEDCLELLEQINALGDTVRVEWPDGEKMRVSHSASASQFRAQIKRDRDWFSIQGTLKLDESLVIDMRQLLEFVEKSKGRFVAIGEGQFIAITEEFRRRLDELRAYSEPVGKGVRVHPLAAPALEDFTQQFGELKVDDEWTANLKRLDDSQAIAVSVPSTLRADLRDYQVEGFAWLSRLAHWGVGACLADDMGLGKTLQALGVILARAAEGPSLVIAPTSVVMNWETEIGRFAPTLTPRIFGPGDRKQTLADLRPFDLLLCSYGLLHQEAEMLAEVQWKTIVLDEAQAIKNMATKRSQAAMSLKGDFRIITTGTPIENHLGELWNLFRFINPGLLGSHEHFNDRFAIPIERYQDKSARLRLKKLIQPFILRRTKNQVLEELPPRTEILRQVELSEGEIAFYEALRREAVEKLAGVEKLGGDGGPGAGTKHLMILAEIMRLRRACCNPKLVAPDIGLSSSKLAEFEEIVDELLENRHKALVFSQFVDHLTILRERLDAKGIGYQYLDGSTSPRDRKRGVDAFQAGRGDLFLISLKAGGLGLNLTAADFVIHMDPWWNPAVEDQASDRAHRIGQLRPVTVYRLVAKNTIEEKIVELHNQKRDLADSLLDGTDMTGKMSTEELLRLLRGDGVR